MMSTADDSQAESWPPERGSSEAPDPTWTPFASRSSFATADERRFRTLFERSPVGMALITDDGAFLEVNDALCALLGMDRGVLLGVTYDDLVHPEEREEAQLRRWVALHDQRPREAIQRRLLRPDGTVAWALVTTTRIEEEHAALNLSVFEDMTSRRDAEQKLLHAALHDPLTGLPNRRLLLDRLEHALARSRRDGTDVAVLFLDLDHVKRVNDSLGHDAGDALLAVAAGRLVDVVRDSDTVARLGGDEFVVVYEGVNSPSEVDHLAQRVLEAVREPLVLEGQEVVVTASVGVVMPRSAAESPRDLLRHADAAMYEAKRGGRGRYIVAEEGPLDEQSRLALEGELRTALAHGGLVLHYQPVVRPDGTLTCLEALVRWEHPVRGLLLPHDFIDLATVDLAHQLSEWVMHRALSDAASWADPSIAVSVNIRVEELQRADFAGRLLDLLATHGLPPESLQLEVLETQLADSAELLRQIERLVARGVRFAVDDFGIGYSSLSYLKRLPVDVVKIDRSFVSSLVDDLTDAAIVRAVVETCRATGRVSVAEGVETQDQLQWLIDLGVDALQGDLVSPPCPLEQLRDNISARRFAMPER